MDSWKTLFALLLSALFYGCASEPHQNASCDLQTLLLQQQRQVQRSLIAKEIAMLPEQNNPFRGSFGQPRVANDPNDTTEASQVNAYNKDLHEKEMAAWLNFELAQSVLKQSLEAQSPYSINRPYNQPYASPTDYSQSYASPNTVRPNAYGLGVNGPEFIAQVIQRWLKEQQIKTIYIEPGCPWQNGYAESFNGRFRRECLNRELIYTLSEGRVVFEDWRRYYNQERPHRSLGLQTPAAFAKNQREQGSGSSRATPSFHRNLEWKQNNKPKPPETVSPTVA